MRKGFLVFLLVLLLASCKEKMPEGTLSTEKMEVILWDLMRAEEVVNYRYSIDSSTDRKKIASELYNQVFNIHKISHDDFKKNFKYYQSRPDLLKVVFDSLSTKTTTTTPKEFVPRLKEVI